MSGTERQSSPFRLSLRNQHSSDFLRAEALGASCSTSLILDMDEPMEWGIGKAMKMGKEVGPMEKNPSTRDLQEDLRACTGMREALLVSE